MSSTERSIPHLRDIFSINSYSSNYSKPSVDTLSHSNQHNSYYGNDQSLDRSKSARKKRDNSKTLTSSDIKTLERHLSMKKTIRKKIMRDLQQMYTDDPNEFRIENTEQLKAEVRVEALRFGERPQADKSDNFLDMLRGENTQPRTRGDYDYDSPVQQKEKQSFWKRLTMKNKSNR